MNLPEGFEKASCRDCGNRADEKPPFCIWLKAEMPVGLADDPTCEGFIPKALRTSVGKGFSHKATSVKGDDERVGGPETPVDKPPKTTCPKTEHSTFEHERQNILQALETKQRGSIVLERVRCGKTNCRCSQGHLHGPYRYWHFYEAGKVRRKYLGKDLSILVSKPREELEDRLRQIDGILGQGRPTVL